METKGKHWRRADDVVGRRIGDEVVILRVARRPVDARAVYSVRGVGVDVWNLLESPRTVGEITARLSREYDAPADRVRSDVVSFVRKLARERLVINR